MKTRIFKYIAVVALLFMAIPMQGQNYLKLWFKDGHTERHFMHLVKSISATKYDLEGNLHSDYQMQQIIMEDTTYSYYIADIDSMSFKKVDEEQIKADATHIVEYMDPIFDQCKDSTSMVQYLNAIKSRDDVEDAWLTGSNLIIQVRDWGSIFYHFPHEDYSSVINTKKLVKNIANNRRNNQNKSSSVNKVYKVVLIDQQSKDEKELFDPDNNMIWTRNQRNKDYIDEIAECFQEVGVKKDNIRYVPCEELTIDFIKNEMFNYDIVYFSTHGIWDRNKHWMLTGEEVDPYDISDIDYYKKKYDIGDRSYVIFEEYRNNKKVKVGYYLVSEDYLARSGSHFEKDHNTIFFNVACESLRGNNSLQRNIYGRGNQVFVGDDSMAKMFLEKKNLDLYYGYNESNWGGQLAGKYIYEYLLNGYSEEASMYRLYQDHPKLVDEEQSDEYDDDGNFVRIYSAHLFDICSSVSVKEMFLVKTNTDELSSEQVNKEFSSSGKVTIKGYTSMQNLNTSRVDCGFRYGDDPNLRNYIETKINKSQCESVSNSLGNVGFSFVLEPAPRQTMYYQAYTYDGIHYNLGEIYSFTTPEASTPYHDLCPDGNHPHMIDLGLPSGTKWSCCNVGASVPTAYGNYYAWGETSTKSTYTKENYKYHHTDSDGKYVYDDATFTMAPTPDQVKELFANCTAAETSVDGVAGEKLTSKKNGKKIFLPYGGAKGTSTVGVGEEYQYWTSQLEKSASNSKLLAPRQYSDNETDDLGNPYAFDWYEKDFRYIGKTVRKASK